jgi:hypothetical protein
MCDVTTKTRHALTYLPWLSLPLVLTGYLMLWNRLPAEMVVHCDFKGAPNGRMSKGEYLALSLVGLLVILSISTMRLIYRWRRIQEAPAKDLLRHCFSAGVVTIVLLGVLLYNVW